MWNFLSTSKDDIPNFVYHLYDSSHTCRLQIETIESIVSQIHMNYSSDTLLQQLLASLASTKEEEDSFISVEEFKSWVDVNKSILAPILFLHKILRESLVGEPYWMELQRRRKKHKIQQSPQYINILREILERHRKHTLESASAAFDPSSKLTTIGEPQIVPDDSIVQDRTTPEKWEEDSTHSRLASTPHHRNVKRVIRASSSVASDTSDDGLMIPTSHNDTSRVRKVSVDVPISIREIGDHNEEEGDVLRDQGKHKHHQKPPDGSSGHAKRDNHHHHHHKHKDSDDEGRSTSQHQHHGHRHHHHHKHSSDHSSHSTKTAHSSSHDPTTHTDSRIKFRPVDRKLRYTPVEDD
jgi:hypothetical protein